MIVVLRISPEVQVVRGFGSESPGTPGVRTGWGVSLGWLGWGWTGWIIAPKGQQGYTPGLDTLIKRLLKR